MKNKFLTLIALFALSMISKTSLGAINKNNYDTTLCLEISGRLMNVKAVEDKQYMVELVYNGVVLDSLKLKDSREFSFNLKKNTVYGIRITKKGYVSRIISIDTSVPDFAKAFFRFQFDTELIEQGNSKNLDQDALDFPIALISFNEQMRCFYYLF
jgi:hypothetical protein